MATVKSIGTYAGGSYGYGDPASVIELWVIDCKEYREAIQAGTVGAGEPWVFPSEKVALRHLRGSDVLVAGHGTGRRVVAGPDLPYRIRALKMARYRHHNDRVIMSERDARRAGLFRKGVAEDE